jgi:hypothetical protein
MLRLMRHAASLLEAVDPHLNATRIASLSVRDDVTKAAFERAAREAVAAGTASAMLRMVAACMEDEPGNGRPARPAVLSQRTGRPDIPYYVECPTCHRKIGHSGYGYPVPHKDPNTGTRCKSGKPQHVESSAAAGVGQENPQPGGAAAAEPDPRGPNRRTRRVRPNGS